MFFSEHSVYTLMSCWKLHNFITSENTSKKLRDEIWPWTFYKSLKIFDAEIPAPCWIIGNNDNERRYM